MIEFEQVGPENRDIIDYAARIGGFKSCEIAYSSILIWGPVYGAGVAKLGDDVVIRACYKGETTYTPIFAGESTKPLIEALKAHTKEMGEPLLLPILPTETARKIRSEYPDEFTYTENRDMFDYLHLTENLAELRGKSYHAKRNHISKFDRQYSPEIREITADDAEACIDLNMRWCIENELCDDPDVSNERIAVERFFENYDELGGRGILFMAGEKVIAFTAGSPMYPGSDTFDVHFEKGLYGYDGIYSKINNCLAKLLVGEYKWLNREDDMGDEGLRRSKLSYYPDGFVEKYDLVLKGE